MKKVCSVCEINKVGLLSLNASDGKVCDSCVEKIGFKPASFKAISILEKMTIVQIKEMIAAEDTYDFEAAKAEKDLERQNKQLEKQAQEELSKQLLKEENDAYNDLIATLKKTPNARKEKGFWIDDANKRFVFPRTILGMDYKVEAFEDLIKFNPIRNDGTNSIHHGLTRAAVGGLAFGGFGAVVGATTGKKTFTEVTTMAITLIFKDGYTHDIKFITTPTKVNTLTYKLDEKEFYKWCNQLDLIINTQEQIPEPDNDQFNDLIKLKELLDANVITQEDFDAKKKQILGI